MFTYILAGHGVDLSRQSVVFFKRCLLLVSQGWQLYTKSRSVVILPSMALVHAKILAVLFSYSINVLIQVHNVSNYITNCFTFSPFGRTLVLE
jgi:hypothetical protein